MKLYDAAEQALNDWYFERMHSIEQRFGDVSVPLATALTLATVLVMFLAGRHG